MYAQAATPTNGFTPKGPKPVFIQIRDIPKGAAPITGEQLYICLNKIVPTEEITGVQRIGALWRVYLNSHDSRVKLISKGLEIRGVTVPVYDTNPFTQAKNEHLTRVTIKDVPLSVNDELISQTLARMKCQIRGEIMRQKLRVNGQLTSCLNGDRACYIEPPSQPLPRQVTIGNMFHARLFHIGQPQTSSKCSKCLADGHSASQCQNPVKCRTCLKSGHMSNTCQTPISDELRNTHPGATGRNYGENTPRSSPPRSPPPRSSPPVDDQPATHNTARDDSPRPGNSTAGAIPKRAVDKDVTRETRKQRQVDISEFLRQAKQTTQQKDDQTHAEGSDVGDSGDNVEASTGSDSDDTTPSPLSPETPTPPKRDKGAKKRKRKKREERK